MNIKKIFLLALVISQILISPAFAAEEPLKVVIQDLKGQVQIMRPGETQGTHASKGTELGPNDTVQLGPDGWTKIEVEKTGEIELEGETTWSYTKSVADNEKHAFEAKLALGRLKANVKKLPPGSDFQVKTPTSIAAVRGTIFSLFVYLFQNQVLTELQVFDSFVQFSNLIGNQRITVGEGGSVTGNEAGKISEGPGPSEKKEEERQNTSGGTPPGGGSSNGGSGGDPFNNIPGLNNLMGRDPSIAPVEPIVYSNPIQVPPDPSSASSVVNPGSSEGHHSGGDDQCVFCGT